jgi:hypothetical protein
MKELERYRRNFLARHRAMGDELRRAVESALDSKSVHQALAELHARQANMLYPCIEAVLAQKGELPTFDVEEWRKQNEVGNPAVAELLAAILAAHAKLSGRISHLKPENWSLRARHPWHGVRTLGWWVERDLAEMEGTLAEFKLAS